MVEIFGKIAKDFTITHGGVLIESSNWIMSLPSWCFRRSWILEREHHAINDAQELGIFDELISLLNSLKERNIDQQFEYRMQLLRKALDQLEHLKINEYMYLGKYWLCDRRALTHYEISSIGDIDVKEQTYVAFDRPFSLRLTEKQKEIIKRAWPKLVAQML